MEDEKYAIAYSEVLDILKYIPKEDYEKIPLEMIEALEDNCNKEYEAKYNPQISLKDQGISKEARTIIAVFFRDYWATEEQKEKILAKEKHDDLISEIEKQEKYGTSVFDNKKFEAIEESIDLVKVEKKNIFKEILFKIKTFFKKNN